MRYLVSILAAAVLAAPAFAQGLSANYSASPTGPVALANIEIGETLFDKGDEYGVREFDRLIRTLNADLERELRGISMLGDGGTSAVLHVTIEDATPNRPTFAQQGASGVSWQSYGRGGAHLTAELHDASGNVIATFDYSWETPDIRDAQFASVWTDTHRTFDRFAVRLARSLEETVNSGS
ncbi:hypothetical protein [Hyphobacterium sp.]|uniref:hypothetical protein n=1 Tax=Hyphobacterium sp. TaxID=2004662 RepID=UPI003BA940E7